MGKTVLFFLSAIFLVIIFSVISTKIRTNTNWQKSPAVSPTPVNKYSGFPLSIKFMRGKKYPGSDFKIEETLANGTNYKQYIASYQSDGLKIYGLLSIPNSPKPKDGYPAIIFNHGYIPPLEYNTTLRYIEYFATFSRNEYVVFKPDYRGNGNSDGQPEGAYYSPAYATDVLNALSSVKRMEEVNPNKIGMWGHSMGGNITLRNLVVNTKDIKAAVIWGGVVGSYTQLEHWHDPSYHPSTYELSLRYRYRANIQKLYKTPEANPAFWNSVDPTYFLSDIATPVQLHAGEADEEVPVNFSQSLYDKLKSLGKPVEIYIYPGADHNISGNAFSIAINRSVEFFDKYLK